MEHEVATLIIKMKNGNEVQLYHSWENIVITEKGIQLIPNSVNWHFDWNSVEKIVIINTNSEMKRRDFISEE